MRKAYCFPHSHATAGVREGLHWIPRVKPGNDEYKKVSAFAGGADRRVYLFCRQDGGSRAAEQAGTTFPAKRALSVRQDGGPKGI